MKNFDSFLKPFLNQYSIVCLVDDVKEHNSIGYTESSAKIYYNLKQISELKNDTPLKCRIESSKEDTILFPLGRYIFIYYFNQNNAKKEMLFIDFRIESAKIEDIFCGMFSKTIKTEFIFNKAYMEEHYNEFHDQVFLIK